MIGDQELAELRQKYYGLFVQLFWQEPRVKLLRSLLEGIEERTEAVASPSPVMAEGWRSIQQYLENNKPSEVDYEFAQLFIGPHQPEVTPYESYYLTGGMFQPPLANVRGFMKEVGLETCVTLGMLDQDQAVQLKEAGLVTYNHNLDTSRENYPNIITTRTCSTNINTTSTSIKNYRTNIIFRRCNIH